MKTASSSFSRQSLCTTLFFFLACFNPGWASNEPAAYVKNVRNRHAMERTLCSFQTYRNDRAQWLADQGLTEADWTEDLDSFTQNTRFRNQKVNVPNGAIDGEENFSLQGPELGFNTNNAIDIACKVGPLEYLGGAKCIFFLVNSLNDVNMTFPPGREVAALHFDISQVSTGANTRMELDVVLPDGTLVNPRSERRRRRVVWIYCERWLCE
mmetsp:Transcript_34737/g.72304  ORF Transcript_34737/g.72304 Transcript_34737/m.72304 type:complete len:211 (-) Transcript_34737:397-1029(-)